MRIIAGKFKNRLLSLAKGEQLRPTTGKLKEAVFNISQSQIEQSHALDLFAGSGAIGFEALSRGAASVVFVESNHFCAKAIQANISALDQKNCARLIFGDVLAVLKNLAKQKQQFNWIYADPPYGALSSSNRPFSHEVLQLVDENNLLADGGIFFIEETASAAPEIDFTLKNLVLKNSRRFGRSALLQYNNITS